tara:strand:+ start:337 stop:507 length:171 start_codon:yes stop_codon:yes gene_type:complete
MYTEFVGLGPKNIFCTDEVIYNEFRGPLHRFVKTKNENYSIVFLDKPNISGYHFYD